MRWSRSTSAVCALLTLSITLVAGSGHASAADLAATPGVRAPLFDVQPPGYLEPQATPGFVADGFRQVDEYDDGPQLQIHRRSDGALVRTLHWAMGAPGPWLSGSSYVLRESVGDATRVSVHDIESGAVTWSVDVPSGEVVLGAGESWVVSTRGSRSQASVVLRRPAGAELTLPGVTVDTNASGGAVVRSSGSLIALHADNRVWAIDPITGATTQLTASAGFYDQVVVTPHRVFWFDANAPQSLEVHWAGADGSAPGSVIADDTSSVRGWYAFGDRLAELVYLPGDALYRGHVAALDLGSGTRETPIASSVVAARSLGDGGLGLVLADNRTGRWVTVADDGAATTPVVDLPEVGATATSLSLSGDRLAAGFTPWGSSFAAGPTAVTASDGTGTWARALAPGDADLPGQLSQIAGDVVATQTGTVYAPTTTLSWPGGQRVLSTTSGVDLGRGGQLLTSLDARSEVVVEDVRTGQRLGTFPQPFLASIDGTVLWSPPDAQGTVVGTDLTGVRPVRRVPLGADACAGGPIRVVGRFALVFCPRRTTVYDLDGVAAPISVLDPAAQSVQLGSGFVVWVHPTTSASGVDGATARVLDLGAGHGTRDYGQLHWLYSPPYPTITTDDADRARFAYLDTALLPRVVDLDWLTTPGPSSDLTAPVLAGLSGSPALSPTTAVSFGWSYTDPAGNGEISTGAASYDVRYQSSAGQGADYGDWTAPPQWQATAATSLSTTAGPGVGLCFQVRARDQAGNVSGWSASRCSRVDGTAPRITAASVGPLVVARTTTSTVTFAYGATDDSSVASYDVSYQLAAPGRGLSAIQRPAALQGTTATRQAVSVAPGGEVCYSVRARDQAGSTSAFSPAQCAVVPIDDRALSAVSATRTTNRLALSGTVTRLAGARASASARYQTGRDLQVVVIRGPGQGVVDAYVGSRRIGRISLSSTTWHRDVVVLHAGAFTGSTVSLRSVSKAQSLVDALAVLR